MTLIEKILFAILFVAVIALGIMFYNVNEHLGRIDENGRDLTKWAATTATWTSELRTKHLKTQLDADHKAWGVGPDHVPPPPDPPPIW